MEIQTIDFSVWPKGKFNAEYSQYFTGNSYLATLEGRRGVWHFFYVAFQIIGINLLFINAVNQLLMIL